MGRRGRQPRHPRRGRRKPKYEGHNDALWREKEELRTEGEEFLQKMSRVYIDGIQLVLSVDRLDELAAETAELYRLKVHGKEVGG
jgi:hypothetical protein